MYSIEKLKNSFKKPTKTPTYEYLPISKIPQDATLKFKFILPDSMANDNDNFLLYTPRHLIINQYLYCPTLWSMKCPMCIAAGPYYGKGKRHNPEMGAKLYRNKSWLSWVYITLAPENMKELENKCLVFRMTSSIEKQLESLIASDLDVHPAEIDQPIEWSIMKIKSGVYSNYRLSATFKTRFNRHIIDDIKREIKSLPHLNELIPGKPDISYIEILDHIKNNIINDLDVTDLLHEAKNMLKLDKVNDQEIQK